MGGSNKKTRLRKGGCRLDIILPPHSQQESSAIRRLKGRLHSLYYERTVGYLRSPRQASCGTKVSAEYPTHAQLRFSAGWRQRANKHNIITQIRPAPVPALIRTLSSGYIVPSLSLLCNLSTTATSLINKRRDSEPYTAPHDPLQPPIAPPESRAPNIRNSRSERNRVLHV